MHTATVSPDEFPLEQLIFLIGKTVKATVTQKIDGASATVIGTLNAVFSDDDALTLSFQTTGGVTKPPFVTLTDPEKATLTVSWA